MAYSYVLYNGDGATSNYAFSFPYLNTTDIKVRVDGVITSYTFLNSSTVTISPAPASGTVIEIRRETPKDNPPVDFADGSVLLERDLDLLAQFNLYTAQEAADGVDQSITQNSLGQWDAQSRRIINVADPVNAGDAVNKNTIDFVYPNVSTVAGSIANVNTVGGAIANVNTVAGSIANVNTVAGNTTNVNKVAAVDTQVTTVANNDANVTTVATDIANVNTTAGSISGVNTTAGSIASVNTVATNIADVNAVSGNNANVTAVANNATNINSAVANAANINAVVANATNINTVSANNANVTKVANIDGNVTTVANNDANVTTVAGISGNVTTVAGISADVTTVATNNANVTAVSGNAANINAVAGNATNINAVAGNETNINAVNANSANINTVAGINADVTTVASNIAAIQDAPNQASAAAASAVSAASSAATAATLLDNFDDRYLGAKASDPALDNDGDALITGALYFNTTDGVMKIYTTSGWIAASSASVATLNTFEFVATAGQTVFSGNDANGVSLSFTDPALMVTLNGVRLRPGDDFTTSGGTSITLLAAATAGDELVVDAFGNFLVANTYTIAQADTLLDAKVSKSGDTMTGALTIQNAGFDSRITLQNTGTGGQTFNIFSTMNSFTQGGGNLMFHTSSAPNGILKMDSAGRVTMPYQPAVFAQRTAGSISGNNTIPFDNVLVNTGGHYSSATGRFTAPVAGMYQVICHGIIGNSGSTAGGDFKVLKNGSAYASGHNNHNNSWDNSVVQCNVSLAVNDYIEIYFMGTGTTAFYGANSASAAYNGLSIHLIG